jgi:hypothetical protein
MTSYQAFFLIPGIVFGLVALFLDSLRAWHELRLLSHLVCPMTSLSGETAPAHVQLSRRMARASLAGAVRLIRGR